MRVKKAFSIFVFLLGMGSIFGGDVSALDYADSQTQDYWQKWIRRIPTQIRRYRASRTTSNWGPSYYTQKKTSIRSSDIVEEPVTRQSSTLRSVSVPAPSSSSRKSLKITANAIEPKQTVSELSTDSIRVFELGVLNNSTSKSTDFMEALLLDTVTFQMYDNTGIAGDPTKFRLRVAYDEWAPDQWGVAQEEQDESFQFEYDGSVGVKFNNARVAKGEDLKFKIDIFLDDPDTTPNLPGNLRLRILSATAITEQSQRRVIPVVAGTASSYEIAFNPSSQEPTQTAVFSGKISTTIYGKALSGGQSEIVLGLGLEAHYDDMLIEEVTVRDDMGDGSIDSFVNLIRAIDLENGNILGTSRFLNGEAKFHFSNSVRVDRGGARRIGFQVQLSDRIDHSNKTTIFRLNVLPSDMVVRGVGSGRDLSDSDKNFTINTEKFSVVQTGAQMEVRASETQPVGFAVDENNTSGVYRFKITNTEDKEFAIGRISLDVLLDGLEFPNGRSVDDFELVQIINGRETTGNAFTPTLGSGNTVFFDAGNEVLIGRRSTSEFILKLKLSAVSGVNSTYASVAVRVLKDTTLRTGTLETLRNNGAVFIWSDLSARPHTSGTVDWLSGYLLSGVSTNAQVNRRYGY